MVDDIIQIRGSKIPVKVMEIGHAELDFYPENPRIFSIIQADKSAPTQDEIQERLSRSDHVKHLVQSIKTHGGLIDPIIVRGKDKVVVEGNSRLAAYRILSGVDPIKWGKIRCKVLPSNVEEKYIFSLLGEYHIVGKKDWAPYEQAGYLYRQKNTNNMSENNLANEIGLKLNEVKLLIEVYDFMIKNHAVSSRWSYYDEYIKSRKIKKARKEFPAMDKIVVKKIKSQEIPKAIDIREGLKKIVEAGGKTLKKFVNEEVDFEVSVERAKSGGKTESSFKKLNYFRDWIHRNKTKKELCELESSEPLLKKCVYELKKINAKTSELLKKLK